MQWNTSRTKQANASADTHTGNIRSGNEDCYFSNDDLGLWLVADGMGGHEAGEIASAIVTEVIEQQIRQGEGLSTAIQNSHQSVLDGAKNGRGALGMGSTVVAVQHINNKANSYQIAWVGDSRAYLWTQVSEDQGELQQLSTDHSYVQALLLSGAITEDELSTHPDKNIITQCLGSQELSKVKVDTIEQEWQSNQTLLLCSDGLSDELDDTSIATIMNEAEDRDSALKALIDGALKKGGRDNVTVILIEAPQLGAGLSQLVPGLSLFNQCLNKLRTLVDKA